MTAGDVWSLIGAALLVGVAALLSGCETALAHVSRLRVEELVRDRRRGATQLATVVGDATGHLNVLLLVRTVAELVATTLSAVVCFRQLPSLWEAVLIAGIGMALLQYVVVGVGARTLGRRHADTLALRGAGIALWLKRVLGPIPRVLIGLGSALIPGQVPRDGFTSEAELRDLVDQAEKGKILERGERDMIHSVFELGDTLAREVMVPRPDMVWIERQKTVRQAMSLALRSGFSRIPVIGDNVDDVVGIVYLKDLARRVQDDDDASTVAVEDLMRPPYLIPESKPVDELLREMQANRVHVAVVIDEYGGTAGMVTIEDILEEIVGEITDEYDREAPRVEELPDGSVRVNVRLPVDDIEEMFGVAFDLEDVETVGGLLAAELGRVPIPGATASAQGLTFLAEGAKGRRNQVGSVVITRDGADATS